MGRRRTRAVVLASAGALVLPGLLLTGGVRAPTAQAVPGAAAPAAGTWQRARQLRLPAPSPGQVAEINDIACPAPGDCVAVGHFSDGPGNDTGAAFTASEVNRRWEPAVAAYGTTGHSVVDPYLETVSCSSAGNCVAGGDAEDDGLILTQAKGKWVRASYFPYSGAEVDSVSCPPKVSRACAAGGSYLSDDQGKSQAWLLYETANGSWHTLSGGGGVAALNTGVAAVTDVSCPSAGSCAAGGYYTDSKGNQQAFVLTESKGVWGRARKVAGSLNSAGFAQVNAMSCASAGHCLAVGGYYQTAKSFASTQGFEVTERNGRWLPAREVPGLGKLNTGGSAEAYAVSCVPARGPLNCAIGGGIVTASNNGLAFVDQVRNGTWQASPTAIEVDSFRAQVATVVPGRRRLRGGRLLQHRNARRWHEPGVPHQPGELPVDPGRECTRHHSAQHGQRRRAHRGVLPVGRFLRGGRLLQGSRPGRDAALYRGRRVRRQAMRPPVTRIRTLVMRGSIPVTLSLSQVTIFIRLSFRCFWSTR